MSTREKNVKNLLRQEEVSAVDIFRADYGVWPPVGIEPAIEPRQKIELYSHTDSLSWNCKPTKIPEFLRSVLHMVVSRGFSDANVGAQEYWISVNHILPYNRANLAGHEATHIMQMSLSLPSKTEGGFPWDISSDQIMEDFWAKAKKTEADILKLGDGYQKKVKISYLESGIEIQARMHTCLAVGYQKWSRLPSTREELWAAMIAAGLRPHPSIESVLKNTDKGQQALADFLPLKDGRDVVDLGLHTSMVTGTVAGVAYAFTAMTRPTSFALHYLFSSAAMALTSAVLTAAYYSPFLFSGLVYAGDINKIQHRIQNDASKKEFWTEVLPQLYGNLLELYGDREGRARLGLGSNETLTGPWAEFLRVSPDLYTINDLQRWADAIDPAKRSDILEKIGSTDPQPNDINMIKAMKGASTARPSVPAPN